MTIQAGGENNSIFKVVEYELHILTLMYGIPVLIQIISIFLMVLYLPREFMENL